MVQSCRPGGRGSKRPIQSALMVAVTMEESGQIDNLISNAGWDNKVMPLSSRLDESWDRLSAAINYRGGHLACTHAVVPCNRIEAVRQQNWPDAYRVGSSGEWLTPAQKGAAIVSCAAR